MGNIPKRPAFCLDMQICTGCKTCMIACKDKNDLGPKVRWRRVYEYSGGEWFSLPDGTFRQNVFAYYLSVSCNHCARPVCVAACPTGAMRQDHSGIVTIDEAGCTGCRDCEEACPYGAPQYEAESGLMTKCDFCRDELKEGRVPACVAACPTRALTLGEREGSNEEHTGPGIAPMPPNELTEPGTIFKPHKRSRPFDDKTGKIANPEETDDRRS